MFAIQNFFFIGPKSDHCIGYPFQLLTHQLTNAFHRERGHLCFVEMRGHKHAMNIEHVS